MSKVPMLGTGLSGLVGSRVTALLKKTHSFQNLDLSVGVDITNERQVYEAVKKSKAKFILHCAAYTDVTGAWQQTGDKNGPCYQVNVLGTEYIAKAAVEFGKHLIHVSTAYIFDGEKDSMYVEEDLPNPIEWYGETKALAEDVVRAAKGTWTIIRIDQPFRKDSFAKPDTARKMFANIQKEGFAPFTDHFFAPTVIEDFAKTCTWVTETSMTGVFHLTCNQKVSDYEFAMLLAEAKKFKISLQKGSLTEYVKKTNRPYQKNTAMSAEKLLLSSGFILTPLKDALTSLEL